MNIDEAEQPTSAAYMAAADAKARLLAYALIGFVEQRPDLQQPLTPIMTGLTEVLALLAQGNAAAVVEQDDYEYVTVEVH